MKLPDVGESKMETNAVLMAGELTAQPRLQDQCAAGDVLIAGVRTFSGASFEKQKSRERMTTERLRKWWYKTSPHAAGRACLHENALGKCFQGVFREKHFRVWHSRENAYQLCIGLYFIAHKLRPRNMWYVEEKAGNRNIEYFTGVVFQWWRYIVFLFYIIAHFSNFLPWKCIPFIILKTQKPQLSGLALLRIHCTSDVSMFLGERERAREREGGRKMAEEPLTPKHL